MKRRYGLQQATIADALVTGRYFHHKREFSPNAEAEDVSLQDRFLHVCVDRLPAFRFSHSVGPCGIFQDVHHRSASFYTAPNLSC